MEKSMVKNHQSSKLNLQEFVILAVLLGLMVVLALLSPEFLTSTNLLNVSRQVAMVIITGSAATLLMIAGQLDLSVGSVVAFAGVVCAQLAVVGLPVPIAIVSGMLCGGIIGAFNGFLVVKLKITAVIATLGSMYICRGLAFILCNGVTVNRGLPLSFANIGTGFLFSIPIPLILMVLIVAVFVFLQYKTVLGKYAVAIGGNKTAATLSGINTGAYILIFFILSGLLAGLAGTVMASRLGVGEPNVGIGFEFDVIVAIVLGGTSLSGGKGNVLGMVIGAFIVGFLSNGLNLMGVQTFYQSVFKGIVLVGAVVLDQELKTRIGKRR